MNNNADYMTFVCISHSKLASLREQTVYKFKTPTKRVLFDTASKLIPFVECHHNCENCSQCNAIFERIVSIPQTNFPHPPPKVTINDGPYNYSAGEWYVIFANKYLGGGYLNQGFVQEEIACFEFPEMATFLANYNNRGRLGIKEVALYSNLFRTCQTSVYGREFNKYTPADMKKIVRSVDVGSTGPCNFLALDAVNVSRKIGGATPSDNMYMLNKAIVGFQILRGRNITNINTGKWGCGAFGNRVSDIFMITFLAAWYAGINITFHLYDGLNRSEIEAILALNPSIADLRRALKI